MSNYIVIYYGDPKFSSPEDAKQNQARWQAWATNLGDALINQGTPLGMPKTVSSSGVANETRPDRLTGFSMVKADSLEAAIEMVKDCPYLEYGTIDVAEAFTM
jgi:hypothetical protein